MEVFLSVFSVILLLAHVLPYVKNQHWVFRVADFARIQLFALQFFTFVIALLFISKSVSVYWIAQQLLLVALIIHNATILFKYTPLYKTSGSRSFDSTSSDSISMLSVNVYQFNNDYQRLIDLINQVNPDIVLTMESNKSWEVALSQLESKYPVSQKVAQENTYGMHFFTKLKVKSKQTHHFVSDDVPSITVELESRAGRSFKLYGVHPPPPSPTEEKTSKERDGELLSVAKNVRIRNQPVVVVGDFNNVAWARSSVLFRKTSELIDARIGRGMIGTFHARFWFLRCPIDLLFHSPEIFIAELKTLENIGSDHLPMYCRFFINTQNNNQDHRVETLASGKMEKVNSMIEDGIEETSESRNT